LSLIRKLAASVSFLNGAWGVIAGLFWVSLFPSMAHPNGGADYATIAVGAVLVLVSVLCFMGFSSTLYASALLSVLMLVFVPGGIQLGSLFLISLLIVVATVVLDVLAARSRDYIPEKDHPMNLPVFG
jgi:hypothetical protein